MKKFKLVAFALKQAESGTSMEEICRKMGTSQATFYAWRKKFGGLRQLEQEGHRLECELGGIGRSTVDGTPKRIKCECGK